MMRPCPFLCWQSLARHGPCHHVTQVGPDFHQLLTLAPAWQAVMGKPEGHADPDLGQGPVVVSRLQHLVRQADEEVDQSARELH